MLTEDSTRKLVRKAMKKLGHVATLKQLIEELKQAGETVSEGTVRNVCNGCSVNGTKSHNAHRRFGEYDPEFHFLLKIAPSAFALPDPALVDMETLFKKNWG